MWGLFFCIYSGGIWAQVPPEQSFNLTAVIIPGCLVNQQIPATNESIGSLGTLDFGTHSSLESKQIQAAFIQSPGISLQCTPGTPLLMSIDGGLHQNSTQRNLQHSTLPKKIGYRLYQDNGHQIPVPLNTPMAITVETETPFSLIFYGELVIPAAAYAGEYFDTLTITLEW